MAPPTARVTKRAGIVNADEGGYFQRMNRGYYHYGRATSAELGGAAVRDDILLLPIAAPENHGPHLPLNTDAVISRVQSERVAEILAAQMPEVRVWLHDTWHLGGATIRGVGSVKVPSSLLRRALKAYLKRFLKQGFRRFALMTVHGAVPHTGALDDVCAWLNKRRVAGMPVQAVAPAARVCGRAYFGGYAEQVRREGVSLTGEDIADLMWDLHAGRMETSMMLAIDPAQVRECYRTLPEIRPVWPWWLKALHGGLRRMIVRFTDAGERRELLLGSLGIGAHDLAWIVRGRREGYVGRPALASEAEGRALLEASARDMAASVHAVCAGELDPRELRSAARLFRLSLAGSAASLAVIFLVLGAWIF